MMAVCLVCFILLIVNTKARFETPITCWKVWLLRIQGSGGFRECYRFPGVETSRKPQKTRLWHTNMGPRDKQDYLQIFQYSCHYVQYSTQRGPTDSCSVEQVLSNKVFMQDILLSYYCHGL